IRWFRTAWVSQVGRFPWPELLAIYHVQAVFAFPLHLFCRIQVNRSAHLRIAEEAIAPITELLGTPLRRTSLMLDMTAIEGSNNQGSGS
ncbi:MAG TPA: hypothetical protein VHG51_21155, partial [Longimicrobiaceae bacterium]|nr:hypothetical protein [Longimicrobiaceae bacterium]